MKNLIGYVDNLILPPSRTVHQIVPRWTYPDIVLSWNPKANLSDDQKKIIRAVWNTGYNLSVTDPYIAPGSFHNVARQAVDFGRTPNGSLGPIFDVFSALHDSWEGGLGIGMGTADRHIHMDVGPLRRWVEITRPPVKVVDRDKDAKGYAQLVEQARAEYGGKDSRDPITKATETAAGMYSDVKTGVKWLFYLAAAALAVSAVKAVAQNPSVRKRF